MTSRRYIVCLCFVLIAAAGLRLWGIGEKSLWLDEIMTVQKASGSFGEMMGQIRQHDAHPPLFQIVEWLWLRLDQGDGFARVPSALFGLMGVWLAAVIARRLFGRGAALAAAVVTAVSYFNIFYSQEARLHAMVATLFLAQVWALLRILAARERAGWGLWAAYAALALASLYTYALCILTIGALAAAYLWHTGRGRLAAWWRRSPAAAGARRPQWGRFAAAHGAVALLFLPWAGVLRERTAMLRESLGANPGGVGLPSARELIDGVAVWGIGPQSFGGGMLGVALGLALLLAAAVCLWDRRRRRPAFFLGALFLLPLAGYLLLPMPRVHQYEAKHLIFLQPLLLIALCGARRPLAAARRGVAAPALYVTLALGALNGFGLASYYRAEFQKEDWRGAARAVTERFAPGDVILFTPDYVGFAFGYYAGGGYPTAGAAPIARGQVIAPEFKRLWVVSCESPVEKPLPIGEALTRQGWRGERVADLPGEVGRVGVERFVREGR
jgi:hypothetical protein